MRRSLSRNVHQPSVVNTDKVIESLPSEIENVRKELEHVKQGKINGNEQKILSINGELLTLKSTIASLQYDLQKNEKSFANDREAIKSMQTSLEESNSKLSARVEELIKIKAVEDDRYNQELSTLQKGLAERIAEVSSLTAELELCRSTLTTVRGDFSKAQKELMQRSEELTASTMDTAHCERNSHTSKRKSKKIAYFINASMNWDQLCCQRRKSWSHAKRSYQISRARRDR